MQETTHRREREGMRPEMKYFVRTKRFPFSHDDKEGRAERLAMLLSLSDEYDSILLSPGNSWSCVVNGSNARRTNRSKRIMIFSLVGAYYCLNMGMIATSTFLCTIVVHIYFRGKGPMPTILRKVRLPLLIASESIGHDDVLRFSSNGSLDSFAWCLTRTTTSSMP